MSDVRGVDCRRMTDEQIKYYVEGSGREEGEVSGLLVRVVEELGQVWMEDEKNGLVHGNI